MDNLINKVNRWFYDRNLAVGDGAGQLKKLQEEVDELKEAHAVENREEMIDAVGDITVVLIGYCLQKGLDFQECLESAYNQIKNRKGKLINGIFVKEVE